MRLAWAEGLAATGNDLRAMGMLMGLAQTVTDPVLRERTETLLEEVRRLNAAREAQAASTAAAPSPPPRAPTGPPSTGTRPPSPPTPIVPEGMAMAEGRITYIGCLGSFQLVLVSGDGTIRLAAPDLSNVDLVSYSTAVTGEMPCGEIEPPLPARVIYRPADGEEASTDGEPLRVDFLP
jgi:hypothetical protein